MYIYIYVYIQFIIKKGKKKKSQGCENKTFVPLAVRAKINNL